MRPLSAEFLEPGNKNFLSHKVSYNAYLSRASIVVQLVKTATAQAARVCVQQ
jgi:hypothetical protein